VIGIRCMPWLCGAMPRSQIHPQFAQKFMRLRVAPTWIGYVTRIEEILLRRNPSCIVHGEPIYYS
jgi:hypothetical protein